MKNYFTAPLLRARLRAVFALSVFAALFPASGGLFADSDRFAVPMRIEGADLYTRIYIHGGGTEDRNGDSYARTRYLRVNGEYQFNSWLGFNASFGRSVYDRTNAAQIWEYDRLGLGVKARGKLGAGPGAIALGGGLKLFDRIRSPQQRADVDNELLLIRGHLAGAVRLGGIELGVEIRHESETNEKFRENYDQEFRRHWQYGFSLSVPRGKRMRFFFETVYREPDDIAVDDTRFWQFYPGISLNLSRYLEIRASLVIPVRKGYEDRGVDFGLMIFLD